MTPAMARKLEMPTSHAPMFRQLKAVMRTVDGETIELPLAGTDKSIAALVNISIKQSIDAIEAVWDGEVLGVRDHAGNIFVQKGGLSGWELP